MKSFIVKILENARGDDLQRARVAFSGFSSEAMRRPYGASGQTPTEILKGYEAHNKKIDDAIAWVRRQP